MSDATWTHEPDAPQQPWFRLMTLQFATVTGYQVAQYEGTCALTAGTTRLDVFNEIKAGLIQQNPGAAQSVVLAFILEPNTI